METSERAAGPTLLESVVTALATHAPELEREFGVTELSVFGSVVQGEAGPDSDVDVLVDFDPAVRIGLFEFIHLQQHLTDLLGRRVDLVMRSGVRRELRERIFAEAVRAA